MTAFADYVRTHRDSFLRELQEIVRIPSVSTEPAHAPDVRHAAEWVRNAFLKLNIPAEILETAGHPAVLAELDTNPNAPTIMIYGHYDVQPAKKEDGWDRDPFSSDIDGDKLIARGAADNKGQFHAHIKGLETFLNTVGRPALNIRFLIEGEEEIGSPNLGGVVREQKKRLRPDAIVISDTSMYQEDTPTICYGLRGLAAAEITVIGPDRDLHSGTYGGAVANPIHALVEILAGLHDSEGRVTIPGFYDDVKPLESWERNAWAELPWDEAEYRKNLGVKELWGEQGYTTIERTWGRPTLEINGIYGGFTGPGVKTVLPHCATAKITMRLVPDQNAKKVLDLLEDHLKSIQLKGIQIRFSRQSEGNPVRFDVKGPWMDALIRALKTGFSREPVLMRDGGSIPIAGLFKDEFDVPILMAGFARPDCGAHGPNEYFSICDYERAIITSATLLQELTRVDLRDV
ncbi:MAG TPA: dipeptidase [bacterium]|nr:dipeptidase [bacterium]HQL63948.1 dipeptidase [bacterium]